MAESRYVIGIDLGGTKVRAAVVSPAGQLLQAESWPTEPARGPEAIFTALRAGIETLVKTAGLTFDGMVAAGIGIAGPVNTKTGLIVEGPNLPGWTNFPVKAKLAALLGRPVVVDNDANAAALGEHRYGAGRGTQNMILLALGTGVGGGIIVNGQLYGGEVGAAGELGHMIVHVGGRRCGCGRLGCLEAYAGGSSLERSAAEYLMLHPEPSKLADLSRGSDGPTTRVLEAATVAGDPGAKTILEEAATHLAAGIVTVVHVFNPELVLFGGGLVALRDLLIEPAIAQAQAEVFELHRQGLRFGYAELGEDMGVLGAAALAIDRNL